jgi:hypothetical protein
MKTNIHIRVKGKQYTIFAKGFIKALSGGEYGMVVWK